MNLFQKSLKKKELYNFICGNGEYLVIDNSYGGHWPLGSYKNYIEQHLEQGIFPEEFWDQLFYDLNKVQDLNFYLDNLIAYFIPYYNSSNEILKKNRVANTPLKLINKIREILKSNKQSLLKDNRGTGAEWNSKSGLWGGITSNLLIIRKRGGPNFLTDEFI